MKNKYTTDKIAQLNMAIHHASEVASYAIQPKAVKDYWKRLVQAYDEQYNS